MLRAQMVDVLQARDILIEQAIDSALDHSLGLELPDVGPAAIKVQR
jgi:hypothetical protein